MDKDKKYKKELKLYNGEQKEAKKVEIAPSRKIIKRVLSFDAYFQGLMKDGKAQIHHKAPMRRYAEQKGLNSATKEEFDRIFRLY